MSLLFSSQSYRHRIRRARPVSIKYEDALSTEGRRSWDFYIARLKRLRKLPLSKSCK